MMNPPKERKYIQCFKSNKDGSCNWCKSRSWKQGYKIYAMKNLNGKWIACTDRQCYLEQGGELTLFQQDKELQNNLNDEVEPFKMIAYSMKDLAQQQKNVNTKILRALRNHEKRLVRIENRLGINTPLKERAE